MTYKCQITCPHCIIKTGPHGAEEVSMENALAWIEQISSYRDGYIRVLSLTGGEPFYDMDKIKRISGFGGKGGLVISVVTNAFWVAT